ncbi:hypothetical protein ABEW33_27290 [Priestia megaterium]|uniref:hypothetical protein n=1 Tax=Priestia megaterium TaxID=1404 RepID=UPI0030C9603E
MKNAKLTITALRAMSSVAKTQDIKSVSLPTNLVEEIADQMETLISLIEQNELDTDMFEDYLLETKERVKAEESKPISAHGGDPRGG